ncbi:efflux RND transporter periplasmic adaptor subunit [Burkholderia cenocepacia]|uniref:efflux RND transporter periplasmic adaptor subunit n=1 Tax=Burkholderia cenocepacia TaxID=95486 RepID=UPI000F5C21E3|nr:efflux RND transporter periplasmic adaptor subunit [Burkholderia cenocepacia]
MQNLYSHVFLRVPGVCAPPRRLLAALCGAVAMMVSACNRHEASPSGAQTAEVGVETVVPQHIVMTTELSGRLSALKLSDVRPQISGIVQKRLFVEGSDVRAGQVLYQIDPASYQANYDSARGTLAKARATLASARTKADRYTDLVKIKAVSQQNYDDAIAAVREAEADVIADQGSLESARVSLDRTRITAPISGRIGASSVTEGALVTSDQTTALATIHAFDQMYLDFTRSSAEWLKLRKAFASGKLKRAGDNGAVVSLELEDGTPYSHTGTLQFSGISVDTTTGSVTLRAIFANPEGDLLPGMFVRVRLEEGMDDRAILVPQIAVSRGSAGQASVYVVDASSKVRQVSVKADTAYGNQWIVTEGLHAGDRVIVSGLQSAHVGAQVKVAENKQAIKATSASSASAPGASDMQQ